MTEEKLREIIQRMIDNNEPEEKIREVVSRAREMMVETPVEEEVVEEEEEVVEEPVSNDNVDWDAVNEMALKLNLNGEEVEEEVLMTEDELNAPIGQVDIYANRKPTEVEIESDMAVSQNIVGNETLQQYEDIQSSPLRKAEAEAQQREFDEKGGQYSIENLDHFVSPENQGILKNAVAEIDEMYKPIEAGTDENFQKKLLEQIMAHENAERYEKMGGVRKIDLNDQNVVKLDERTSERIKENQKPENQFKRLLEEDKMPSEFDPEKWAILQEWKANGFISKESLNSLDPNVVTSVKNQYKRNKLNDYFHANDDLTKDKRKYVTALLAEQTPGDLGYSEVLRMENDPEYKALKLEQQEEGSKDVVSEMKEIQAVQEKPFGEDEIKNEDYFKVTAELTATSKKLNEFTSNGINKYSSPKELEEYNKTFTEYQTALKTYNANGYGEVVKSQTARVEAWSKDREKLMNNAIEMNNVGLALELGSKNYSHLEAAKLSLTKAAFDVFGQSLLQTAGMLGEGMEYMRDDLGLGGSASMYEMEQFLQEVGGVGIDAERSYREYQEEAMAPPATFEGAGFDEWLGSTFAEGIPSVATVISLIYGPQRFTKMIQKGARRKLIKQGASKQVLQRLADQQKVQLANVAAKSSKLTQGIFFGMSYSGKAVDMALQQQDAPEKLKKLRESLAAVDDEGQPLLNAFERNQALSEIESLNNVMDWTVLQRAGSSLLAGGVEMYAERIGTLGYMKNLNRIAAPVKAGRFKRMMYTGLNTTINATTELVEETATQMANNLSDIYILGEDKSVIDGINAEFFAKVAVTSLAIQGPQIGGGIWNSIQSEVLSKREAKENMQYLNRLIEVEDALSNPIDPVTGVNLTRKQIDLLRAEKKSILKSAAFGNVVNTQKLARMSMDEKKQLFEFNRERRKILNQLNELGGRGDAGSKAIKKQKEELVNDFKNIDEKRNELLTREERNNQEKFKDSFDPALAAYNKGLNSFYNDVVQVQQGLNGDKFMRVTNDMSVDDLMNTYEIDKSTAQQLVDTRDQTQVDENGQTKKSRINATFVGNDIVVFEDNIDDNLRRSDNKLGAKFAAVSPMHELLHLQNRNAGIVKDGRVVGDFKQAVKEAEVQLKEKLETGKITQEEYDGFIDRKALYTLSDESINKKEAEGKITPEEAAELRENDGVDVEEVLNIFGDMVSAGVLSRYDFSKINGLKYALKNLVNKYNSKDVAFLMPMNTAADIYSYIDSFQKAAQDQKLKINIVPDEKESKMSLGASEKVQQIFNEQGEAGAFDIIEQFKPITNKIVQKRSEAPGFDRQLLTDEIETGERGILDLIRSYDPESGVPLAAYINKFLPSRAIEASKRVLGEEFTDDITEKVNVAAVEESDNEVVNVPKRKIKLKNRLTGEIDGVISKVRSEIKNLPIDQLDFKSLKNVALDAVQELFGIKPKPGNLTKQDVKNAQQYINKNAEALILMLPEGATPSGTSTGVPKVLLDNFYTKTDRAKMSKTGSKAGLAIYEKRNNITSAEFKEVFGITPVGQPNVSDRNTSARIKALVAQTERMLTNQEVREALEEKGENIPQALIEGKGDLMYSEGGFKPLTAKQKQLVKKYSKDFEKGNDLDISKWNKIVQAYGYEAINMNTVEGKKQLRAILFEGIDGADPLIRSLPKSFFTLNGGTWANGGMYKTVKDENGKRIELNENERNFLKSNGITIKADESVKRFKLENGKTILNTDEKFVTLEIQLQIMPGQRDDGSNNFLFANGAQLKHAIEQAETLAGDIPAFAPENTNIDKLVKRTSYSKVLKKGFTDEFVTNENDKREGLKDVLSIFNTLIKENPSVNIPAVAAILSSTSGGQGHFIRKGSIITFLNDLGLKNVEEHTEPASDLAKYLFNRMVQGNFNLYVDNALDSFTQGALPYVNDDMLKGTGFNYTNAVDKKYKLDVLNGKIPIWVRYFNPFVNKQKITIKVKGKDVTFTGVDPNSIQLSNGLTIAQNYGVDIPSDLRTPSTTALQQDLLFELFTNPNMTKQIAQERIKAFLKVSPDLKASKGINIKNLSKTKVLALDDNMTSEEVLNKAATIDKALELARKLDLPVKKIRVFDFDDTLARTKSKVFATRGNEQKTLTAEEFAAQGEQLTNEGWEMDFSDFNKVVEGQKGPLFQIAKKITEVRGNEDLFILTARSPAAQDAIYDFLQLEGLEFKKENIIGLGNSSPYSKSNWIIEKAAEGYNDFYFADDHLANVQAVKDVLEVIDVKSKVQQAKLKFSKGLNEQFDEILAAKSKIQLDADLSGARAQVLGANKGRFKFWIPYSAEDFVGLLYPTLGKGAIGDLQMAWYKRHLLDPYSRAMQNISRDRLQLMNDFKKLKKALNVPKDLTKPNKTGFTNEQAIRVWLYDKTGGKVPNLNDKDIKDLVEIIENDPTYLTFANELLNITKGDGWVKPGSSWLAGTITTDLMELLDTTKRKKYLEQWTQNKNQIFSEVNLNKLEALYGAKYREALENMLQRMSTGKNRTANSNRLSSKILNYINGSNAAIMFLNTRSAVLQTISAINFVNWGFNNPLKAGQAFANQPQYWKDFMELINSDYLKDRRGGLRINVTESEISDAAKTATNKAKAAMAYILEKGYLPTQFADSFAIASGGATFYRNRINDLIKNHGLTAAEAKNVAYKEFVEISEDSQQSSRPDKISQQQASDAGRLILMFSNTPMQYARLQKKAFQDLANGRGDAKSNISKIIYYGFIQNLMFNALQQAVFALGFGGEDEEEKEEKIFDTANGMLDSILRGLGIGGATVSVVKNFLLNIYERSGRSRPEYADATWELLKFSPPISSKISKMRQAAWPFDSKKRRAEIVEKGFSIDNPAFLSFAKVVAASTNVPLDRVILKYQNLEGAFQEETEWWETIAMISGWPKWTLESKPPAKNKKTSRIKSRPTSRINSRVKSRLTP